MADHSSETLNQRRVLVTGASSQIGVFAIPRLLDAGFHVVAVSRQTQPAYLPKSEQLQWLTFDQAMEAQAIAGAQAEAGAQTGVQVQVHASTPANVSKACNYLLSAGPMSLAVQALCASNLFKQVVIFSSSSVLSKRNSSNPAEKQMIENMRAQEAELETLASQQNLKMVIFRPTLIYGCGLDENISRLAGLIKRYGVMPVNGKASGLRQPVHADDLAQVALNALVHKQELPAKLLLTGGSTISYTDMVKEIFEAFKKPVRILHVPQWLLVAAISILKLLGLAGGVSVVMVKRQMQDLEFDNSQARRLLNFQPRPFKPTRKDFELP